MTPSTGLLCLAALLAVCCVWGLIEGLVRRRRARSDARFRALFLRPAERRMSRRGRVGR